MTLHIQLQLKSATLAAVTDAKYNREHSLSLSSKDRQGRQGHIYTVLASGPRDFRGCFVLLRGFLIIHEEGYKPYWHMCANMHYCTHKHSSTWKQTLIH